MKLKPSAITMTLVCAWLVTVALNTHVAWAQDAKGIGYRVISPQELAGARKASEGLLRKIDVATSSARRFDNLYLTAGLALKTRYSSAAFSARLTETRDPLGKARKREFAGFFGPYHTIPNIIAGDYLIIVFDSEFEKRQGPYTEHVTLEKDRSGAAAWRLVQYYVAPKAE